MAAPLKYKEAPYHNHNNKNSIGVSCCLGDNNVCGSLFVPPQISLSKLYQMRPAWNWTENDEDKHSADFKEYLSQSRTMKSLLLPLSRTLLLPVCEYVGSYEWDPYMVLPDSPSLRCYDAGTIALLDGARYLSLKEERVLLNRFPPRHIAIGSLAHFVVFYNSRKDWLYRDNVRINGSYEFTTPKMDSVASPFLTRIQSKLVPHRFAVTSPYANPWDCILMAIDKTHGYLVYTSGHDGFQHAQDCWIVLDSLTNYTTGDLLYFNKDGNFYVLPNAQCSHLEVWRFQNYMCSKESEINAEFQTTCKICYHHIHSYLVESLNGNLLLVRRYVSQEDVNNNLFKTNSFEVFKLNFQSKQWEIVPSLGDEESIFVGTNSSFSLSSSRFTEVIPNCIYFTDQICHHQSGNMLHGKDNGIFHLQDGTIKPIFNEDFEFTQAPVWLCPADYEFVDAYLC